MSEAKFTKGCWKIDESYQSMLLITDYLGTAVTEVDSAGFYSGEHNEWTVSPTEAQKANANLIAAAPDFYDDVNSDISWLEQMKSKFVIGSYEFRSICLRIETKKKLLAKARGEKCVI